MDKAPKDKETGLSKLYVSGLSNSTKKARAAHWAKTKKMDPGNPAAYEPAPGDKTAKTKESKYTKAYKAKFGEDIEMEEEDYIDEAASSGLAKKAKESGISIGTLRKVYNRGMAAWRTGHRPGTTPQQWAMARVNSYIMKGKGTYGGADKDLHENAGLWANINAKRKRIAAGSGERMRKPGSKGAPTADALKAAQESYTAEPQSTNKNDSSSRFYGTDSATKIYKNDTPGQTKTTKQIVKQAVREATYQGKQVPLNKPMAGDIKKSKVYVDPDGDGKAQKVNFGDKNLSIKKNIPARKRSYCARSSGQGNLTNKASANYWSRRAWNC